MVTEVTAPVQVVRLDTRLVQIELSSSPNEHPLHLGALVCGESQAPLPLQKVTVRASVSGATCVTHVRQLFHNELDKHMAATHLFPVPADAAITHMMLKAGDLVVQAETRPKKDAQEEFNKAEQAGHRAALLTVEPQTDVHRLSVTNLPPKCDVEVTFSFVQVLQCVDGSLRWLFPTVIAPRYAPKKLGDEPPAGGVTSAPDGPAAAQPSSTSSSVSWPQPPIRLSGGTLLDLEVVIHGKPSALSCSQHAVSMDLDDSSVKVRPSGIATLNKDFVLAFSTAASKAISTCAFTNGAYTAVVVQPPRNSLQASALRLRRQAVFIIDISGSMSGKKIETSKRALISALHSLAPGDEFKLVAFDDRLELFDGGKLNEYTDANVKRADKWISKLSDRGGTEMGPALEEGFRTFDPSRLAPGGKPAFRSLLFITDGESWNEAELVKKVASLRDATRDANGVPPTLFTLGIDTAVNESLLRRLARIGGGVCELTTPDADIEAVIMRLETNFGGSVMKKVELVSSELDSPYTPLPGVNPGFFVSTNGGELYTGRPLLMLVKGTAARVRVRGLDRDGGIVEEQVEVAAMRPIDYSKDDALFDPNAADFGALFAKQRIVYLEDVMMIQSDLSATAKREIEKLGLEFNLVTSETSKVAVERTQTVRDASQELVHVMQQVELPEGWNERFRCITNVSYSQASSRAAFPKQSVSSGMMKMCVAAPVMTSAPAMPYIGSAMPAPPPVAPGALPQGVLGRKSSVTSGGGIGGFGGLARSFGSTVQGMFSSRNSSQAVYGMSATPACEENQASPVPLCEAANPECDDEEECASESADEIAMGQAAPAIRSTKPEPQHDIAGEVARLQNANGSFDSDDVESTCFALMLLVLLGHTTSFGVRQKTVLKAVQWLQTQSQTSLIQSVLALLEQAESGPLDVVAAVKVAKDALVAGTTNTKSPISALLSDAIRQASASA